MWCSQLDTGEKTWYLRWPSKSQTNIGINVRNFNDRKDASRKELQLWRRDVLSKNLHSLRRAINVYDVVSDRGYRVVLPKAVTPGCSRRDVLYLALVRKPRGSTIPYFTYLSSSRIFSIKTQNLWKGTTGGAVVDVGVKNAKIVLLSTNNRANIFFRNKDIYMWNTDTCFKTDNFILVQKGGECRLAPQVLADYKKLMWILESNFHDFIQNTVGCAGASVVLHPLVKSCDD